MEDEIHPLLYPAATSGASFTALLGLPPSRAVELLHEATLPSAPSPEVSPSPPPPPPPPPEESRKRKDGGSSNGKVRHLDLSFKMLETKGKKASLVSCAPRLSISGKLRRSGSVSGFVTYIFLQKGKVININDAF